MRSFLTPAGFHTCPPTELVVAESVVVIKKLLQMQPEKHSDIIKHMAKLTDNIQVGPHALPPRCVRRRHTESAPPKLPAGADGEGQHPVADRRVLRARAQDRSRCVEEDGEVFHQRGGHCEAPNHKPGGQAVSDQLQTGRLQTQNSAFKLLQRIPANSY